MDIDILPLNKKDFKIARSFAIEGMHLSWYTSNKLELYLYTFYFWSLEISRATRALGAYMGDKCVGVLLADIKGEDKLYPSILYRLYIQLTEFVLNRFYKDAANAYDDCNQRMLDRL